MSQTLDAKAPSMKGITWNKRRSRYRVQARVNGYVVALGDYLLLDEAVEVRDAAFWFLGKGDFPEGASEATIMEDFATTFAKIQEKQDAEPYVRVLDPENRELRVSNPVVKDLIEKVDDLTLKLSLAAGKLHAHEQALEKAGLL